MTKIKYINNVRKLHNRPEKQQTALSLFLHEISTLLFFRTFCNAKVLHRKLIISCYQCFWSSSFELPVCTSLSDTKPLTYRVWDMLVDLNLYEQTIDHMSFLISTDFMRYWINHNATIKNKTVQPVPKIQPV